MSIRLWYHPGGDLPPASARHPGILAEGAAKLGSDRRCVVSRPPELVLERCTIVHDVNYINLLADGRWDSKQFAELELQLGPDLLSAFLFQAAGTVACIDDALVRGVACALGGGFHHAFADRAEGFCLINDVAVGVAGVVDKGISRVLIIDCDVHQGNGTAAVFRRHSDVVTVSVHSSSIYPVAGPSEVRGDIDIGLDRFTDDKQYLTVVEERLLCTIADTDPSLVVYLAGTDVFYADQLGDFLLTAAGVQARDQLIIGECIQRGIAVAVLLMAGYPYRADDQIMLWTTCWQALIAALDGGGPMNNDRTSTNHGC